jgi:solute carrier family 25 (mitochondrial carnitine/acylcarnitine transporter), member 20/29
LFVLAFFWRNLNLAFFCGQHHFQTQMQLDNITRKQYKSSLHCIQTLVESHGIRIIYTGHVVNTIREATFLGNYFFVYEGLRELFLTHHALVGSDPGGTSAKIAVPVAGGLAGAFSWFISFPLDCIRAGVQGQPLVVGQSRQSAIQICRSLIEDRGIRGLYSGASASILRAFLVSGSRFSAYEGALWLLRGGRNVRRHEDEL